MKKRLNFRKHKAQSAGKFTGFGTRSVSVTSASKSSMCASEPRDMSDSYYINSTLETIPK